MAHRAAHESAPENSLAAIREAIRLGCDYVELDVRRTKDGAIVLMHDRTVAATTNATGNVADLSLFEIKQLRLKTRDGKVWQDEQVPTFDEALAVCKGKIGIYIDNKAGIPAEVLAAVEHHGMLKRVVVYDGESNLREFKRLQPKVWIMPDHPGSPDKIAEMATSLRPETMDGHLTRWTADELAAAHKAGVQVWVDVMNKTDDEVGWATAVEWNVDGIQTDHPGKLIAYLKRVKRR